MRLGRIVLGLLAGAAVSALWKNYSSRQKVNNQEKTNGANRYVGETGSDNPAKESSNSYSSQFEGTGSSGPKTRPPFKNTNGNINPALG